MFMKNEHSAQHAKDIRETTKWICLRERPMLEDVHPKHSGGSEGNATCQPPPVGELACDKGPSPCRFLEGVECHLHKQLPSAEQDALYNSKDDEFHIIGCLRIGLLWQYCAFARR